MKGQTIASVFLAGAFFFGVDQGVVIDGVDVGGMPYRKAEKVLRPSEEDYPSLTIGTKGREYSFSYPEIGYTDNLFDLVRGKKGNYQSSSCFFLNGESDVVDRIARDNHRIPVDAAVTFSRYGFAYTGEKHGEKVDRTELSSRIRDALITGQSYVEIPFVEEKASVTKAELLSYTKKLASFTTSFDASQENRSKNIALSARRIDGTTLAPGEVFSFNDTVGARSKQNGFLEATVISEGVFVKGVGGGVCQVSTTLYNAVLLSGLTVVESRAHSLSVSYVLPSFDAMVSSSSDFQFRNDFSYPVYVSVKTGEGRVTATVYGKETGLEYKRVSKVLKRISPPESKIVEGEEDLVLRPPKEGMVSEAYLDVFRDGKLVERRKLRKDRYEPVQGIEQKAVQSD